MNSLIENNRQAIAELCRHHGVQRLEAFGSILRDDFDAGRSDVDILVQFQPEMDKSFENFRRSRALAITGLTQGV